MQYSVSVERPRGVLGLLTRKIVLGKINEGEISGFRKGSTELEVRNERAGLVITNSSGAPLEVEFGAEPQMGRPRVVELLDRDNPETRTGRSRITITPLNGETRSRLVLKAPAPRPLTLTRGEVRAVQIGIDAMRGNVEEAARVGVKEGYRAGFAKGHQEGRVIQTTQL